MGFKKISVIVSKTDLAGLNISEQLITEFNFKKTKKEFDSNLIYSNNLIKGKEIDLIFINEKQVAADYLNELETDLFVFASKHSSESGKPTFSVHSIGNFNKAELGGKEKTLVKTSSLVIKNFFLNLLKQTKKENLDWPVLMEQTHHGPFLSKPSVFIEIGSTETEWKNKTAGKIIAFAIMDSFFNFNSNFKTAVGVGGTHYCPSFFKVMAETDVALSHILSKYYVNEIDFVLFEQMIKQTSEKVDFVLFDWKGLVSEQRKKIISFCEKLNLDWKKSRDLM